MTSEAKRIITEAVKAGFITPRNWAAMSAEELEKFALHIKAGADAIVGQLKPGPSLCQYTVDPPPKTFELPPELSKHGFLQVGFVQPNIIGLGGVEEWNWTLITHLPKFGCCVRVLCITEAELNGHCDRFSKFTHVTTDTNLLAGACQALVFWNTASPRELCPNFTGPRIVISHGVCEWSRASVTRALPGSTHWVGVSSQSKPTFPEPSCVTVINNGVEHTRCNHTINRWAIRAGWGLDPDDIAIGYMGRWSQDKNPQAAAIAAAELGRPFRAVYVCPNYQRENYERTIKKINPSAVIIGPRSDVGNVLRAFDVLVQASHTEGFSLGLVEAWYCKLPTVATRVGAVDDLEREVGGRPLTAEVSRAPDGPELAAAVKKVLDPSWAPVIEDAYNVACNHTGVRQARDWASYLWTITRP